MQGYNDLSAFVDAWPIVPAKPGCLLQLQKLEESVAIQQSELWNPDFEAMLLDLGLRYRNLSIQLP